MVYGEAGDFFHKRVFPSMNLELPDNSILLYLLGWEMSRFRRQDSEDKIRKEGKRLKVNRFFAIILSQAAAVGRHLQ